SRPVAGGVPISPSTGKHPPHSMPFPPAPIPGDPSSAGGISKARLGHPFSWRLRRPGERPGRSLVAGDAGDAAEQEPAAEEVAKPPCFPTRSPRARVQGVEPGHFARRASKPKSNPVKARAASSHPRPARLSGPGSGLHKWRSVRDRESPLVAAPRTERSAPRPILVRGGGLNRGPPSQRAHHRQDSAPGITHPGILRAVRSSRPC
ncbi:MAG: hypothetical protein ACI9F9_003330, partial [Candidatus Paceibacteria bacterium]